MQTPAIRTMPGRLPRLWDRQGVFVANLLALFFGNEHETEALREKVGTLETYGGRLVPVLHLLFQAGPCLLVLNREPNSPLLRYQEEELGLSLPKRFVISHEDYRAVDQNTAAPSTRAMLEEVSSHPAPWVDGFVTDSRLEYIADQCGKQTVTSSLGSRAGNNKLHLHRYLKQTGLPTFPGLEVHSPKELPNAIATMLKLGFHRAAVKSQIGASGIGLLKIDLHHPGEIPHYLFHEGACLVQGWLDASVDGIRVLGSPSVQFFVDEESVSLYDITDQILSQDSVHEGNLAPLPYEREHRGLSEELLRQAGIAAQWLHAQGYRGTASVDFHVVLSKHHLEVRICEINARVTGATYPALLARYFLPQGAWLMRNLRFQGAVNAEQLLHSLRSAGLLYRPSMERGVLPVNFNTNATGEVVKGQYLCLDSTLDGVRSLLTRVRDVLHVESDYDRD